MLAWLRHYAAHADPVTAAANLVALVVAGNGPFYPIYVLALIQRNDAGVWLTMLASPLFFAIPALARRSSMAGRLALPLVGTVNTVWCVVLLGSETSVGLFLLPCVALTALLFRHEERWTRLLMIGLILAALVVLSEEQLVGLVRLERDEAAALVRLNTISVATLTAFMAITFARLFGAVGERRMVDKPL